MNSLTLLLAAMSVADLNPDTLDSRRGYVLEFSATWCGPCQEVGPIVSKLARNGYPIRKVELEKEPALARKYQIKSIPTFVLVVDGREHKRLVGAASESQIRQLISLVPRKAVRQADPQDSRQRAPESTEPPIIRANIDSTDRIQPSRSNQRPMAASVRIRVQSAGGTNYGSGTIISSQTGRTLILTCGHIVRKLSSQAVIEVDFFAEQGPETFVAELVEADQQADLGVIKIQTADPLPIAPIARTAVAKGETVMSIGCGGGEDPTLQSLQVTALNRYLGPDNVECTGVPVQGRSGGGLFNQRGEVVGVCIAADPKDKRGLYCGLQPVREFLQQLASRPVSPVNPADGLAAAAATDSSSPSADASLESRAEATVDPHPATGSEQADGLDPFSPETIADVAGNLEDAEVVCIIRSRSGQPGGSRVVIINQASQRFIRYLTSEMKQTPRTARRQSWETESPADEPPVHPIQRELAPTAERPAVELQRSAAGSVDAAVRFPQVRRTGSKLTASRRMRDGQLQPARLHVEFTKYSRTR